MFCANKLSLNILKTNYLIFHHGKPIKETAFGTVKIGSEIIKCESHTKFLGLHIDDKLKWDKHLKYVNAKLSSSLYVLNSVKTLLKKHHLKMLYYTLVYPYINYGILLWGSANKHLTKQIFIKQKKAIRIVSGAAYNSTTEPIFKSLCIPTLKDMYAIEMNKLVYSFYNNNLPKNILQCLFIHNKSLHQHQTRHRHDPHITNRRTAFASETFIHMAPKKWQILPDDIKMPKAVNLSEIS